MGPTVVRLLPCLVDLSPFVVGAVAIGALGGLVALDRDLLACAGAATVGSVIVAYGLCEVPPDWDAGYYCFNHAVRGLGLVISAVGWVILFTAFYGPTLGVD